VEEVKGADYE
jgi:hypothetical protein